LFELYQPFREQNYSLKYTICQTENQQAEKFRYTRPLSDQIKQDDVWGTISPWKSQKDYETQGPCLREWGK